MPDAILRAPTAIEQLDDARHHQRPYSEHDRARAFQVWIADGDRLASQTSQLILEYFDLDIPTDTVRRWAREGKWGALADAIVREIAPDVDGAAIALMIRAKPLARRRLIEVVQHMDTSKPTPAQMMAVDLLLRETTAAQPPPETAAALDTANKSKAELMQELRERLLSAKDSRRA